MPSRKLANSRTMRTSHKSEARLPVLSNLPRGSRRQGRARGAARRAPRVGCAEPVTAALPRAAAMPTGNLARDIGEDHDGQDFIRSRRGGWFYSCE
jgi:hypothetical protein